VLLLLLFSAVAVVVYTVGFHEPDNEIDETKPFDVITTAPLNDKETKDPENTTAPKPQDKEFNFLLLGKDQAGANTDVIMLINYNVTRESISVLQFPRDTYVELDNISYKINSLYAHFYNEGYKKKEDSPEKYGLSKLSETLEKNLCINIHYYAMVNLAGFRNIVDILGGVEVDIPADMDYDDNEQNLHIHLKKGKQLLDGKKAEQFVRFRAGYVQADIGRMDAQKIFMSSLLKTVKDKFNITTIVKIANEIYKHVTTNVPLDDMVYFGKNLLSIDMEKINFMSMPGTSSKPTEELYAWYYVMNRKAMISIIEEHFNIYNDIVIDDAIFDPNRIFTSEKRYPHIDEFYNNEPEENQGGSQSAEDIIGGSIHIPRY
jgi:LCP family protein required for cell wall assembly